MNIHTPQLVPRISQQVQDQAPALDIPPTPQQVLKASHWATMARLHAGVDVHDFTTGTVLATIYSTVSCSQLFVTVPAAGKGEVYLRTRAYEQEVMPPLWQAQMALVVNVPVRSRNLSLTRISSSAGMGCGPPAICQSEFAENRATDSHCQKSVSHH